MIMKILISVVSMIILEQISERLVLQLIPKCDPPPAIRQIRQAPKYWLFQTNPNSQIFESIEAVLIRLGLERTEVNASTAATIHYNWDLLWSFEYFPHVPLNFSVLNAHQRVNHLPGIAYLTNKSLLASLTKFSKYIPRGFTDINELKAFAEQHPDTRFVQKLKSNRGVSLRKISEMNLTNTDDIFTNYFAQVFVEDPLLIGGHKFDFNIYVVITSIDPLRVYYYSKTYHMRFCKKPYNPTNFDDLETYVVADSNIPGLDFPEIQKYFNKTYTAKDAFNMFLIERGHDPNDIVKQVEECINTVVMDKEPKFIEHLQTFQAKYGKHHFFELLRFDFIIDSKLNLHLMEINLSPNLIAHSKVRNTKHMLENVLYNTMNLVGIGAYMKKSHIREFEVPEVEMVAHVNSLTVLPEICTKPECSTCSQPKCELCKDCWPMGFEWDLKMAYVEHMNRGDMKRVVPPSNVTLL